MILLFSIVIFQCLAFCVILGDMESNDINNNACLM